jgi:phage repressor protein C with HTH and peptisase S24 domain
MEPEFKEGDTIIVDPDLCPGPGDYVVAKNGRSMQLSKSTEQGVSTKMGRMFLN